MSENLDPSSSHWGEGSQDFKGPLWKQSNPHLSRHISAFHLEPRDPYGEMPVHPTWPLWNPGTRVKRKNKRCKWKGKALVLRGVIFICLEIFLCSDSMLKRCQINKVSHSYLIKTTAKPYFHIIYYKERIRLTNSKLYFHKPHSAVLFCFFNHLFLRAWFRSWCAIKWGFFF